MILNDQIKHQSTFQPYMCNNMILLNKLNDVITIYWIDLILNYFNSSYFDFGMESLSALRFLRKLLGSLAETWRLAPLGRNSGITSVLLGSSGGWTFSFKFNGLWRDGFSEKRLLWLICCLGSIGAI